MVPLKQDDSENAHEHGRRQIEYDADRDAGRRERDQRHYRLQLSVVRRDDLSARRGPADRASCLKAPIDADRVVVACHGEWLAR